MIKSHSSEFEYNIVIDILAEMVTSYLTNNKGENPANDKKGDNKNAN